MNTTDPSFSSSKSQPWRIVRQYLSLFSCEEAVEKLVKAHLETEESK